MSDVSTKDILNSMDGSMFALFLSLFQGNFTLYDYSQLLPLFNKEAFAKIASYMPDNRNFKMSSIINNIDIHKKIIQFIPVDIQKQNPETYVEKDLMEYVKKAGCDIDSLKNLLSFIIQLRKMGPRLQTLLTNEEMRKKLTNGDMNAIFDFIKNIV